MAEGSTLAFLSPTVRPRSLSLSSFMHSAVQRFVDLPGCSPGSLGLPSLPGEWLSYLSQQDKEEKNKAAATRPRAWTQGRTARLRLPEAGWPSTHARAG